ncbi:MAG: glycosyltransferase family 2 protein [Anaerolineaceae bacterium]|nr:glycosyltransferase family 2 protein [Anaerolineaceae bacterium]
MYKNKCISVIIPAFNAEFTVPEVVQNLPVWVDSIILINDNSEDGTLESAQNLKKKFDKVDVIDNAQNLGVGGAMKEGYKRSLSLKMDISVKMDSDGQMDPGYLPQLLDPLVSGQANYTKGNRFLHTAELKQMPIARRIGNLGLSFLTKAASGYWNIFDPTNGYTAIDKQTLEKLDFSNLEDRFFFESSMLMELYRNQAVVKDIAIPARYNGENSSLSTFRSFFEFSPKLVKGFIQRINLQYFTLDFTAVSLFLLFGTLLSTFGLIWGIWHWIVSIQTKVAATTGTVMLAVVPLILGFQFLLQAFVLDIGNVPKQLKDSDEMADSLKIY